MTESKRLAQKGLTPRQNVQVAAFRVVVKGPGQAYGTRSSFFGQKPLKNLVRLCLYEEACTVSEVSAKKPETGYDYERSPLYRL